jgi:hypothetical protein
MLPREYRQPRIYYLEYISLSTIAYIQNTDEYIYSYVPKFQEILSQLETGKNNQETSFLIARIKASIREIENFKREGRFMWQANQDLKEFLEKESYE